jgi:hypothetical protein
MKYYKTDSRKISFREYWHVGRGRSFLKGWLNKILRRPMTLPQGIPEPQPFRDKIIDRDSIPAPILERFDKAEKELRQLGFDQFWFYGIKNSLTGGISRGLAALHSSKIAIGNVIYVSVKTRESQVVLFSSDLADGMILLTTNKKRDFDPTPGFFSERRLGASAAVLWGLHQKRLAASLQGNPPKILASFEQVAALEDKKVRKIFDEKLRRGVWVEMTDNEVAALRAKRTAVTGNVVTISRPRG